MTTPIIFLIGRLLVCYTGMYRFDLNRRPIVQRIGLRFISNLYIPVSHTNRRPIKNTIGVVMNHLVGMGLKALAFKPTGRGFAPRQRFVFFTRRRRRRVRLLAAAYDLTLRLIKTIGCGFAPRQRFLFFTCSAFTLNKRLN